MSNPRRLILLLVCVGISVAVLRACLPSDERRIQKRLAALAEEVATPAQGKALADLAAANRLADFFAPEFQIQVAVSGAPDLAIDNRGELVQTILAAKSRTRSLKVALLDPRMIELGAGTAMVEATARAEVADEPEPLIAELRFSMLKVDGRWRVRKVENVKTFE